MRKKVIWVAAVVLVSGAAAWWLLQLHGDEPKVEMSASNTGRILYYQDPSGAAGYSSTPRKDAQGRDYVAVRAPAETTTAAPSRDDVRRILYYRNPMGLADTSQGPKKDSMGMDYIAVYADETGQPGTVKISLDKVQRLGVRTAMVMRQVLNESVLLTGTVALDERKLAVVSLKFRANVVKLHVAATGERVRKGQKLFDIQSPFILKEELDLALALRAREGASALGDAYARSTQHSVEATRTRLRLYEVPEDEIARLIRTQRPSGTITWRALQSGIVIEKTIVAGMQAEEGAMLYRLADVSNVWVIAEAPEAALAIARPGATARISLNAFPGRTFRGQVTFVYPEVAMATRTVKLRIELPNPQGLLIPGMFASVEVAAPPGEAILAIPDSALIDSGTRQVVLIARGEGLFEPRAVTAGNRANGMVEIVAGLNEGESVVTSATFLIDAESNLRAALQSFTQGQAQ